MNFIKANLPLIIVSCLLAAVVTYDVFFRVDSVDRKLYDQLITSNKDAIQRAQKSLDSLTTIELTLRDSLSGQSKRIHDDSLRITKLKQRLYDSQKIIDTYTPSDVIKYFNDRYGAKPR